MHVVKDSEEMSHIFICAVLLEQDSGIYNYFAYYKE